MVTVMTPAFRLISAGAVIVGITFGLARYGYGLLLPDLRAALELDSATLGLIGSGSIAAYLLATAVTGAIAARVCARGGALGVGGMAIVARGGGAAALAVGILVAAPASGLVFPPFADAV